MSDWGLGGEAEGRRRVAGWDRCRNGGEPAPEEMGVRMLRSQDCVDEPKEVFCKMMSEPHHGWDGKRMVREGGSNVRGEGEEDIGRETRDGTGLDIRC